MRWDRACMTMGIKMGIDRLCVEALHPRTRPLSWCLSLLKAIEGPMNLHPLTRAPLQYPCKQLPAQRLCSRLNVIEHCLGMNTGNIIRPPGKYSCKRSWQPNQFLRGAEAACLVAAQGNHMPTQRQPWCHASCPGRLRGCPRWLPATSCQMNWNRGSPASCRIPRSRECCFCGARISGWRGQNVNDQLVARYDPLW